MCKYFGSTLFIFLLAACGDTPQSGAVVAEDTTVAVLIPDTSISQPMVKAVRINEGYVGREPITATVKQVLTHIPDGYYIIDTCSGDLDHDNYVDYLVLLAKKGEDSLSKTSEENVKRRLLILTGTAEQSYTLAAQSDNAVYCVSCGGMMGDPYQQMVIKNGYFSIEHYGGSAERWTRTITFKYSAADNTWYLHKDGHESFNAIDPEQKGTKKILTVKDFGKLRFNDFDIYKD